MDSSQFPAYALAGACVLLAQLRWTGLVIAAPLAVTVVQMFTPVQRTVSLGALSTTMLVMAFAGWRASRREPCMGHAIIAGVLALYPLAYVLCLLAGSGIDAFRYAAILPLGATGLTLIAISLSRARWRCATRPRTSCARCTRPTRATASA